MSNFSERKKNDVTGEVHTREEVPILIVQVVNGGPAQPGEGPPRENGISAWFLDIVLVGT